MHRTEGPDYTTIASKRRYKESPTPATIVNKDAMNAIQEEICLVVENAGLTLNATGSADETAGWGQLWLAILRSNLANVVSYGADPTGAADATSAFNSALAAKKVIYIPPNSMFKLDGALTLPDNGGIIGAGFSSVLKFNNAVDKLAITNQNFVFSNFKIEDGGSSPNQTGISINFTADKKVILNNIHISEMLINLEIRPNGGNYGTVFGNNIFLINPKATGTNLRCNEDGASGYGCNLISINRFESIVANATDFNLDLQGSNTNGDKPVILKNGRIYNGEIFWSEETSQIWLESCIIDVDEHRFDSTNGGGYRNCILPDTLSNTITNNDGGSLTRTFWENNKLATGKRYPTTVNYDGIYCKRKRITSAQSVGATSSANVAFNEDTLRAMTNNASYTKTQPWDSGNARFTVNGQGKKWIKINCSIVIRSADTSTWSAVNNIYAHLDVADGSGGGEHYNFNRHVLSENATTGELLLQFSGHIPIPNDSSAWIAAKVVNGQAGAIDVSNSTVQGFTTFIEIEGL